MNIPVCSYLTLSTGFTGLYWNRVLLASGNRSTAALMSRDFPTILPAPVGADRFRPSRRSIYPVDPVGARHQHRGRVSVVIAKRKEIWFTLDWR